MESSDPEIIFTGPKIALFYHFQCRKLIEMYFSEELQIVQLGLSWTLFQAQFDFDFSLFQNQKT